MDAGSIVTAVVGSIVTAVVGGVLGLFGQMLAKRSRIIQRLFQHALDLVTIIEGKVLATIGVVAERPEMAEANKGRAAEKGDSIMERIEATLGGDGAQALPRAERVASEPVNTRAWFIGRADRHALSNASPSHIDAFLAGKGPCCPPPMRITSAGGPKSTQMSREAEGGERGVWARLIDPPFDIKIQYAIDDITDGPYTRNIILGGGIAFLILGSIVMFNDGSGTDFLVCACGGAAICATLAAGWEAARRALARLRSIAQHVAAVCVGIAVLGVLLSASVLLLAAQGIEGLFWPGMLLVAGVLAWFGIHAREC
jgi:hypothetical protein